MQFGGVKSTSLCRSSRYLPLLLLPLFQSQREVLVTNKKCYSAKIKQPTNTLGALLLCYLLYWSALLQLFNQSLKHQHVLAGTENIIGNACLFKAHIGLHPYLIEEQLLFVRIFRQTLKQILLTTTLDFVSVGRVYASENLKSNNVHA